MRSVLVAAIALAVANTFGVAHAADMPTKASTPAVFPQWSGFYVGGAIGGGWTDASWRNLNNSTLFGDALPGDSFSHRMNGVLAGLQLGVNRQFGPWVLGLEAQIGAGNTSGNHASTFGAADDQFSTRIDALFLGTGRIGYAVDRWLSYVKGGYALARVKTSVGDVVGPSTGSGKADSWRSGPVVGAGIEYALSPNISAGIEYDYIRLDSAQYQLGGSAGSYLWQVDVSDVQLVMARLNFQIPLAQ
jgi:outer membrane immunogenic protein